MLDRLLSKDLSNIFNTEFLLSNNHYKLSVRQPTNLSTADSVRPCTTLAGDDLNTITEPEEIDLVAGCDGLTIASNFC